MTISVPYSYLDAIRWTDPTTDLDESMMKVCYNFSVRVNNDDLQEDTKWRPKPAGSVMDGGGSPCEGTLAKILDIRMAQK